MRALVLLSLLVISSNSYGWGYTVHKVVCDLTFQSLNPEAREVVQAIVRDGKKDKMPSRFDSGCVWVDRIRNQKEYAWTKPLHYINVPRRAKQVTKQHCSEQGCVISAIQEATDNLTDCNRFNQLSQKEKRENLYFLGHFITDLHQPLHVSYADDRGGNSTEVQYFGRNTNLHRLWDSQLLVDLNKAATAKKPPRPLNQTELKQLLAMLDVGKKAGTDLMDIANESYVITRQIYQELNWFLPDAYAQQYVQKFQPIALQQIAKAQYRLKRQLERICRS